MTWKLLQAQPSPDVEYRVIPGFPGYHAGADGSIWSCRRKKGNIWRRRRLNAGHGNTPYQYVALSLGGKRVEVCVHVLVLLAFHGPCPPGCEALHTPDPDPTNNRSTNLRWGTHTENMQEAVAAGRIGVHGDRHGMAKLRCSQLGTIKRLHRIGFTMKQIGYRFGVSAGTICMAINGKTWAHATENVQQVQQAKAGQ